MMDGTREVLVGSFLQTINVLLHTYLLVIWSHARLVL